MAKSFAERVRENSKSELGEQLVEILVDALNKWHSHPEIYDNALDAEFFQMQADILKKRRYFPFKEQPYFSPSASNSDKRGLYERFKGGKKDKQKRASSTGRWLRIGEAIGGVIQRDLLFMEKHFEKEIGERLPFKLERTKEGYPAFEDFAKTMRVFEHKGHRFSLFGKPDGILQFVSEDGEIIRVGLEIKSKQTTFAQTGHYSMKDAKEDHVKQCVGYGAMYDLDHYIVLYVNASKKEWDMDEETFKKNPDIRGFYVNVTKEEIHTLFDYFADVLEAVKQGQPPKLDLWKWTFNNFKEASAKSLTDEEYAALREETTNLLKSNLPEYKKQNHFNAMVQIKEFREAGASS